MCLNISGHKVACTRNGNSYEIVNAVKINEELLSGKQRDNDGPPSLLLCCWPEVRLRAVECANR
jgi:hypothetical protein